LLKNQTIIPRTGNSGPLVTYVGGDPDLTYIMEGQQSDNVGAITFNYFQFSLDDKGKNWKQKGFPSLFSSNNVFLYFKAMILHELLHVLKVNILEGHNTLTFQEKINDPVSSCTNLLLFIFFNCRS